MTCPSHLEPTPAPRVERAGLMRGGLSAGFAGSQDRGDRMVVGVLRLDLMVPEAMSLKDKRRVIKSLKDRLGARHNVSVAEVGSLDSHRRCELAVAMVSNDGPFTDSCLSKIVDEIRLARSVVVVHYDLELF